MTALLESSELIVRGDIRARAALHALEHVNVYGDTLTCIVGSERVELDLGAATARRWAAGISAPPPTLARKLGITAATRVHITGRLDDDALRAALANAAHVEASTCTADLAIVRADDSAVLLCWMNDIPPDTPVPPTWVVYVKGRNAPLGERGVREAMRRFGFIDTKVAAVSERLTALRFVQKRT